MFRKTSALWPIATRCLPIRQAIHSRSNLSTRKHFFYSTLSTSESAIPSKPILPWRNYHELLVENNNNISAEELENMAKYTLLNKGIKPSVAISRIQDILKYMSTRQDNPDIKACFSTCCNYLIRAYVQQGDMETARLVFDKMATAGNANEQSITEIISGLRTLGTRGEVYEFQKLMESRGLWTDDTKLYINIIYALGDFGDIPGCRYYFAEMKSKHLANTSFAYRAIMSVYRKAKQPQQVLKYFNEMKQEKIQPTLGEYGILFASLRNDPNYTALLKDISEEMKTFKLNMTMNFYLAMGWDPLKAMQDMTDNNVPITVRDCNSGLNYYIKNNQFSDALNVMKSMNTLKIKMDSYSYGILINALSKDMNTAASVVFDLYNDMKRNNLVPDQVLYTSLITNCCKNQDLDKALSLLHEMQAYEIKPNTYTFNSILNVVSSMASTSSVDVERAGLIWSQMTDLGVQPDTRTCNIYLSLISKLIKPVEFQDNGRYLQTSLWDELEHTHRHVPKTVKEIQRMYRYMKQHKLKSMHPDFVTYSIVINAMSAAGEVRSALQVYDDAKMSRVTLPVSTCNEMMIALQRCGRVSESMGIWHDMKLQSILPDNVTYSIVLENCEQLGLTESIESIRRQRKLDFDRLQHLEQKKKMRSLDRYLKTEYRS